MHEQYGVLTQRFDWNQAHAKATGGFTDGGGIGVAILAGTALLAIWGHEAGIDNPGIMAESDELPSPVVGTGAGFHDNHGGRRIDKERQELFAGQCFLDDDRVVRINTTDGDGILGQINTETDNMGQGLAHS